MKYKRRITFTYTLLAYLLVIFGVSIGLIVFERWLGIFVGIGVMLLAIPFHLSGKQNPILYLFSFVLNSIGVGFSISTYYQHFNQTPSLEQMIFVVFVGLIALSIVSIITSPKVTKKYGKLIVSFFIICFLISTIILWVNNSGIVYSLLFFFLNISYFYMVANVIKTDDIVSFWRIISIVSFGAFIVISLVILIIISEGEVLQGLDGLSSVGNKNKKNK